MNAKSFGVKSLVSSAVVAVLVLLGSFAATANASTLQKQPFIVKKAAVRASTVALFLGDSFTVGVGAPNRKAGFAYQLASHYRWTIENYAVGHTGYLRGDQPGGELEGVDCGSTRGCPNYSTQVDQAIAAGVHPDIVIVSGGYNDKASKAMHEAAEALFIKLHAQFANAKIYVTSPITTDVVTADLQTRIAMVRVAAFETDTTFLDLEQPLAGKKSLRDHIHPNLKGHTLLAKVIASKLDALNGSPQVTK